MREIFDVVTASKDDNVLKISYEKLLEKLTDYDVKLYLKYENLVSKMKKDHPRLLNDLKEKLDNPVFELNDCGNYILGKEILKNTKRISLSLKLLQTSQMTRQILSVQRC